MKKVRFIPIDSCGLRVREAGEDGQESRTIEGKPIVFGVRSNNLTPWSTRRKVFEVIEPGSISEELLKRSDILLNLNHSTRVVDVLGRHRGSDADTLKLSLKPNHVASECELPKTSNANDTLELIKRGDITGMSFAFEDDWEDSENGVSYERITEKDEDGMEVWLRHVKRIVALYDVSVVTYPAYEQTSVAAREQGESIEKAIEKQIEAAEKRENPDTNTETGKQGESGKEDESEKRENPDTNTGTGKEDEPDKQDESEKRENPAANTTTGKEDEPDKEAKQREREASILRQRQRFMRRRLRDDITGKSIY